MDNTLIEYDALIGKAEENLSLLTKRRSGFFINALTYPIRDHKFMWKEQWDDREFKTPTVYLALAASTLVLSIVVPIAIWVYTKMFFFVAIFLIGLPYAIYDFRRKYKLRIKATLNGLDVNSEHTPWQLVHQCYIMEYLEWNRRQRALCIVLTNGELKDYDILGVDEMKLSHAIFKYLQHYRATSQPS